MNSMLWLRRDMRLNRSAELHIQTTFALLLTAIVHALGIRACLVSSERHGGERRGLHGVGGQLEGLLADVQLLSARGVALARQQLLHLASPLHQAPDHLHELQLSCEGHRAGGILPLPW